jgi:hypothetical protein
MKQPRVIQRLSSLSLAVLLLFTAVWGHDGLAQRALQTQKATRAAAQANPQKADGSKSTDAQLSAAQFEAVVMPAPTVGGGSQTAFLLPCADVHDSVAVERSPAPALYIPVLLFLVPPVRFWARHCAQRSLT